MKWLFYTVLMLFSWMEVSAQDALDEAKKALQTTKDDSTKLLIYDKVYDENKLHNIDKGITFFTNGYTLFQQHKYLPGQANMLFYLGTLYEDKGIINVAKENYRRAFELFTQLKKEEYATDVINALGVLEGKTGNYEKATDCFLKALKRFTVAKNNKGIVNTYIKLGTVNEFMGNLDKSLDYYQKALSFTNDQSQPLHIIHLYNNIGVLYCRMDSNAKGIYFLELALAICNSPKFSTSRILPLTNLGIAAHNIGNDAQSAQYYTEALQIAEKENLPNDQARLLLQLSSLPINKNDAQSILARALNIVEQTGHKRLTSEILSAQFKSLKKAGNYKEALSSFEKMKAIDDSIAGKEKQVEIANLEAGFELSQSKEKVNALNLSQSRIKNQRNITYLFAGILFISLVVVVYFLRKLNDLNKRLRKREEELDRLNQVKDRIFTVIGHDLKSPITNILFILELLIQNRIQGKTEVDTLHLLKDDSIITLQALDNLLNWSRSQLKGEHITQTLFNPGLVIVDKLKLLKNISERKHITIANFVKEDILVYADIDNFRLIIRNLLSNAIKFTPQGGLISVNAKVQDSFVVFEISDTGLGINEEKRQTLFSNFGLSAYGTANEKGNGIGLMLCKHFVEINGGQIWVESVQGKGTTFYFSLYNNNLI